MLLRSFLSFLLISIVTFGGLVGCPDDARAQTVAPEVVTQGSKVVSTMSAGTPRQQVWLNARIDQRAKLAEQLGDEGARAFAASKGWTSVYDGTARGIAQGPDQVYRSTDGIVHVIEAKGGGSPLGRGYGYVQGSPEWAVESAKSVLRQPNATVAERNGAKAVLDAAARGRLHVHVVRTSHVLGEPTAPIMEQAIKCSDAAVRLARSALDDSARGAGQVIDDLGPVADDATRVTAESGTILKTAAKAAVPVAIAVDAGLRVHDAAETERQFTDGEITAQQREVAHATNAAGMAGGWSGAVGGAWVAGEVVAPVVALTGPAAPYVEGAAVVAGGVAGYYYGEEGAKQAAEWAVTKVHEAGTTVADSVNTAWDWTATTWSNSWSFVVGE